MASGHHVTLREVAAAAGVHVSTVSLALRESERLPRPTRERIQRIARKLGYAPSAIMGALARYRSTATKKKERPRIAWITLHPTAEGWREFQTARQSFRGAKATARALGYDLVTVWLGEKTMTAERATRLLRAQKIVGLLIAPAPEPTMHVLLPWQDYPAVGIGLSLLLPALHVTANHHYRSAKLAMRALIRHGYRRIGLVLLALANERVEQGWLGGYLVMAQEAGSVVLPPLILPRWDRAAIRRWYRQHRPDAILTRHLEMKATLATLGIAVPGEVGLAFLSVPDRSGALAGIDENARTSGAGAIALMADMIARGEKGIPATPQRLLFEGTWIEGRTVRTHAGAKPQVRVSEPNP